jgi:hypothetical protein
MTYQPSYQLKLDRAAEHLQSIEAQDRIWRQGNPCRVWTEPDIQSGGKRVWAEVIKPPPLALAPVVGDCVHNLRSALDNLAFELALVHKGTKMSKRIANDSGFPIFKTSGGFNEHGKLMIRGIRPEAKEIVERLQPYNRGNVPITTSSLWWLRELSNSDKHRLPHLAVAAAHQITLISTHARSLEAAEISTEPFEDRAVIAKFDVPLGAYTEVSMQRPPTFGIVFGERSPDFTQEFGVVSTLANIQRYVTETVVPPLVRYLA